MLREESTGFVGNQIGDLSYDFQLREGVFPTTCEEILVFHKKQLKTMRPQEVGDGMLVPVLTGGVDLPIDKESIIGGMCVYEWFDENTGTTAYYAYGVDRKMIPWILELTDALGLGVDLEDGKFIKIVDGKAAEVPQDDKALSWLFGLALIYGKFTIIADQLKHVVIQLPLSGSIAAREDDIFKLKNKLFERGLFLTSSYVDQKSGQLLQINIDDTQILNTWGTWIGAETDTMSEWKILLQESLGDDIDLSDYVLKLLRK